MHYIKKPFSKCISCVTLFFLVLIAPCVFAGTSSIADKAALIAKVINATPVVTNAEAELNILYDQIGLSAAGLTKKAFGYAYEGYKYLLDKGMVAKQNILSICDFSQSSRNRRLYIIDIADKSIIMQTYVAHGRNSGGEFAKSFSNKLSSRKTSLGFYLTKEVYFGENGVSLKLEGLEKGINDNAEKRAVVVHGADYLGDSYINNNPFSGRSFGCPAVPQAQRDEIINTIKDGSILFIYHPTNKYLNQSRILNG